MKKIEIAKEVGLGLSKAILIALFTGAVLVAPGGVAGTLKVLGDVFGWGEEPRFTKKQLRKSLAYLQGKKLLDIQREYEHEAFALTKLGYLKARKLARSLVVAKPERWDGKWRAVVFDIPETKKDKREVFRRYLKNLGFANVQKSIWLYPYECRDQIFYLAGEIFIKPYVRYMVLEDMTGQQSLKKRFGL